MKSIHFYSAELRVVGTTQSCQKAHYSKCERRNGKTSSFCNNIKRALTGQWVCNFVWFLYSEEGIMMS